MSPAPGFTTSNKQVTARDVGTVIIQSALFPCYITLLVCIDRDSLSFVTSSSSLSSPLSLPTVGIRVYYREGARRGLGVSSGDVVAPKEKVVGFGSHPMITAPESLFLHTYKS